MKLHCALCWITRDHQSMIKYFSFLAVVASVFLAGCGASSDSVPATKLLAETTVVPTNATFSGERKNYTVTKTATGYTITDKTGVEAVRTLTNVTSLKFLDVSVNLGIADLSSKISAADLTSLIELYVAFFNRIPDADGLSYWITQRGAGQSLNAIAGSFYNAGVQFSSLTGFSAGMSHADFVNLVYRNVLGRSDGADAGGLSYWTAQLASGAESHGSLVSAILASAHTFKGNASFGWVANLLDNKIAVARAFAIDGGLTYNSPDDSITKGMAIAAAVTPSNTNGALVLFNGATSAPTVTTAFGEITPPTGAGLTSKIIAMGGDEINVLSYAAAKLINTAPLPDLHQTFLKLADGTNRFWIQGGHGTSIFTTTDFTTFNTTLVNGKIQPVIGPSSELSTLFDADYAGAGSVFPAANKHDLLMIYHAENHYGKPYGATGVTNFYSTVGLARSTDAGLTWSGRTPILTGREAMPASVPASIALGAGDPSAIITGGYIYVFFGDYVSSTGVFKGINQMCLARAPIQSDGAPGSWMKYYKGAFTEPGVGGLCSQPVPAPSTLSGINFQGNADISFNTALNAYLFIFLSDDGFFYSTSPDMLTWTTPKLLMRTGPQIAALRTPGATYYYKPTFITPGNTSDQITGATGYLFYAKGIQNTALGQNTHSWYRQSVTIK